MQASHAQHLSASIPLPTAAGVQVQHRGRVLSLHPANGNEYRGVGGIFDFLTGGIGTIVGAVMGDRTDKRRVQAEQAMASQQLNFARYIADLQAGSIDRQTESALAVARIQAENEIAAINAQYATQLAAQRVQKQVAEDAMSTQLLAQTQTGIFNLADTGVRQAASVATAFPKSGTNAAIAIVGITVIALAWSMKKPGPKGGKKRSIGKAFGAAKKRFGGGNRFGGNRFGGNRFGGGNVAAAVEEGGAA